MKVTSIRIMPDGSHEKVALIASDVPGPGTYSPNKVLKRTNIGGAFTKSPRMKRLHSSSVSTKSELLMSVDPKQAVLKSNPAFGFGTSRRPTTAAEKSTSPGPGEY